MSLKDYDKSDHFHVVFIFQLIQSTSFFYFFPPWTYNNLINCLDKWKRIQDSASLHVSKWLLVVVVGTFGSPYKTKRSYTFLLQPASPPSPRCPPQRGWYPGKWQTSGSEPAGAPRDSLRALSSWWTWTAVGSGGPCWRALRSAVSNKWSGYPITSLSTSVRQKDMARCKINKYHLATAVSSIVRTFSCWRAKGGAHPSAQVPDTRWCWRLMKLIIASTLWTTRYLSHASWQMLCSVAQHPTRTKAKTEAHKAKQSLHSQVVCKPPNSTTRVRPKILYSHSLIQFHSSYCKM